MIKQKSKLRIWIEFRFDKLKEYQKTISDETKLKSVRILNYLINSFLISIPIKLLFIKSYSLKEWIIKYICLVISLWILIPFIEHYYVWFIDGWKHKEN